MNLFPRLARLLAGISLPLSAAQPWREITLPTVAEAAAAFPKPPREYGAIHWAIWGGPMTKERIAGDIERMEANGAYIIMINNSRGLRPKYFSPEYLELVKFTVAECKKRGMKVWIENDAGYPDGMAGGLISKDYPELGMQALVADAHYSVAAGQTLKMPLPPDTLGILASTRQGAVVTALPLPANGQFQWTAPNPGMSEVVFVRHVYRSSPTRYTNRDDGTANKDSLYSLIDYLNADATRTYLKLIHETYEKILGDEFGKTILGFRGDEPDYTGFMPWTPKLLETFQRVKGYDLQPYLAQFFAPELTPAALRAKADYWDVWSAMFRDNYFKPQEEWCQARGMDFMVHLNHEELMIDLAHGEDLIRNEGSFFRAMRYVGVPGVDNLNQTGPGIVADFPKLAASTAHVYGRPQAWTEQGGNLHQSGKFVIDHQLVRGINFLQIRGANSPLPETPGAPINPSAATMWYVNRASYLLASGRPAAQVALFHPTDSMWLGDREADDVTVKLVTELMEHQIDFDHIDSDGLAIDCTLVDGGLKNLSGQIYRAVIVPTSTAIDQRVLERLRSFSAGGGKVIFVGRTPTMVVGPSFLNAKTAQPDLSFATLEPTPSLTDRVIAALPRPDVNLDSACPAIKYTRRTLKDGDVYFFFNESNQTQKRTVTLSGKGQAQVWDATHGTLQTMSGARKTNDAVTVSLNLAPQESRFIVVGPVPATATTSFPDGGIGADVADLSGEWPAAMEGGATGETTNASGSNALAYRREFTVSALNNGKRIWLDLGEVHEDAQVSLNGASLEVQSWPPYLWDVTMAVHEGKNTLEIKVWTAPPAPARGGFGGPPRDAEAPIATSSTKGFSPSGVPGGLKIESGRGGRAELPGAAPGNRNPSPTSRSAPGLRGPVRLFAE